ncbi:MAG TPA: methylated-DNA--[protein]-cysteine S-methyltransferase [Solirubrobacteraceae bacterium]|jgi:methylated-DNA-[protein]-cysteine S-methyltransferase
MTLSTPIGSLGATFDDDGALTSLHWGARGEATPELQGQLDEYFAGERRAFDFPLAPAGTPWQQAVWRALLEIPYGATITYTELAARAGRPGAARAAGAANGRNPIAILIPCHRVIGTGGGLTGYAGGVGAKAWLLALERGDRSPAPSPGSTPRRTTGRRARLAV